MGSVFLEQMYGWVCAGMTGDCLEHIYEWVWVSVTVQFTFMGGCTFLEYIYGQVWVFVTV